MIDITDTQRLDFLRRHQAFIKWSEEHDTCRVHLFSWGACISYLSDDALFASKKEAIDACIAYEKSHE